jgi:DnaJ domain
MTKRLNFETACKILEIDTDEIRKLGIDREHKIIKRKYREKALLYHPDKNSSHESCEKFQEINEAYQFLLNSCNLFEPNVFNGFNEDETKRKKYKTLFMEFLCMVMGENQTWNMNKDVDGELTNKLFRSILYKITDLCQDKALEIIQKIEKNTLLKVYEILLKYSDYLHISGDFLDKINQVLINKIKDDQCILLNPTFKDIYNDQVYKLVIDGEQYLIPLWHKELVYDVSGSELIVRCIPVLPLGVSIDENNNISVYIEYEVNDFIENFWGKQTFDFYVDGIAFHVPIDKIRFIENQEFKIYSVGISIVNERNIYDVRLRSDVTLYLRLIHIQK